MARQSRRDFLKQSVFAAGATFAIGGTKSSGKILGSNEAVRIGVAGLNGRGSAHVQGYNNIRTADITYVIDPDKRTWASKIEAVKNATGRTPKAVTDVREALEDGNLDAISIATPNHWHALMTIWACQAGKDVYVEKPMSHNIHEGRVAVEAARKHDRIVQHGTQSRSSGRWAQVVEIIKSGQLGKLQIARALCYKNRNSIGVKPAKAPPAELDFNIWLGPAAEQPYHENLVHYNWHWFWETGNGDIGNQGVHQFDIARWGIPGATLPKSVQSVGGRFGYQDQGETPNTQVSVMDFGDTQLIFEVRGRPTPAYHGVGVGNVFHLEGGIITDKEFFPTGSDKAAPLPKIESTRGPGGGDHFLNFVEAVRSRKQSDLNAEILEGHYSSALCHLANVSYRLGKPAPFQESASKVWAENAAAQETVRRMESHLKEDVKLDLAQSSLMIGSKLDLDPESEKFVGNEAANALLFREYRKPFEVPASLS